MSVMAQQFYNAWKIVMDEVPQTVLCTACGQKFLRELPTPDTQQ